MNKVVLDQVKKDLKKLPIHIVKKLQRWAEQVEMLGIHQVRKSSGWHDEALRGTRKGQRSIRLSKAYRAMYLERNDGEVELIVVIEVNKHKY